MKVILFLVARAVLGVVFITLGVAKLEDPITFLKLVRAYQMVPETTPLLLNLIAAALPWLEILLGVLVLLGIALRGTGTLMFALLAVFSGAIFVRGLGLSESTGTPLCDVAFDCGCGTGVEYVCAKLWENAGLLLLSVVVMASRARTFCARGDLFGRA